MRDRLSKPSLRRPGQPGGAAFDGEPWWCFLAPWRNRALIWQLARRELLGRYRGSWLGTAWMFLTPLILLGVYTVVFRHVFKTQWSPGQNPSDVDFALQLFAGLAIFQCVADLWSRAPRLIVDQANLVTKVRFPLSTLGWAATFAALLHLLGALLVWLAACLAAGYRPQLYWLALPSAVLPLLPWLLGVAWLLSSVGVYLRDLSHLSGLVLTGVLFLSPVFYPTTALPAWLAPFTGWIPLAAPIEALRLMVFGGTWPDFLALGWILLAGIAVASLGAIISARLRPGFADLL